MFRISRGAAVVVVDVEVGAEGEGELVVVGEAAGEGRLTIYHAARL